MKHTDLPDTPCTGNCDIKYLMCYNQCATCGWMDEVESVNGNIKKQENDDTKDGQHIQRGD